MAASPWGTFLAWCLLGSAVVWAEEPMPLFSTATATASGTPSTSPAATGVPLDLKSQKEQRFRELKRQMEILSQLPVPVSGQPAPETSVPEKPASDKPVPEQDRPIEPVFVDSRNEEESSKPSEQKPVNSESPRLLPSQEVAATPAPPQAVIVEGTIDRFALATSLFGTGQSETCLDVLRHTDLTKLSREDQIWADYMQACCHRKLGNLDQARQIYRRILAEKDADWIGKLASWWLNELDSKAQLQSDVQRLSQTLAAWETEIENLSRKSTRTAADQ
ncbi:hypothetical protein SH661x_000560 [Planctomicrobium sp. SH661]|uniref:tetratricopeptide repeat protein n=1 Tax=Planctomicrobium sp. SH661 TaxID=3448124 RepID=UPI003F5AF540